MKASDIQVQVEMDLDTALQVIASQERRFQELERLVKEWRAMAESLRDQALDAENRGEDWAFLERVIADGWEQAASRLAGALRRTAEEDG